MEQIKDLYDGINFVTIPKVISDELKQHGSIRSSISKRGKDGKFTTTYGDLLRPIFALFYYNELNFRINTKHIEHLFKLLNLGLCIDINNNILNRNNIEVYYNEYSKGFIKGYNEFESTLKNNSSIFENTNEQISFKVYSRIKQHFTKLNDGVIILNAGDIKINNNVTFLFTEENFFKSGFYGGEFYKAWEIILKNPILFEPIFQKNKDLEDEKLSKLQVTENDNWTLNDYYKDYIKTGRFGFTVYQTFKSNQFDELSKRLNETKKRYDFIFNKLNDNQRIEFKNDFCDQLAKLKTNQTESKNIEIIQTLFLKINDEYNHYHTNSKLQIEEYKSAINGYFEMIFNRENDNNTPNSFYYYNQIRNFVKDKNNFVKTNIDLKKHTKELVIFNGTLESILIDSFKIFKSAYKYNIDEVHLINNFNISKSILIENLKVIKSFRQSINIEIQNREFESAIFIKNYCVTQFKNLKSFLNSDLCIDIEKSPLKAEFDEVLTELQNSVDIKEVEILMKSSEVDKTEPQLNNINESKVINLNVLKKNNDFNANYFNENCYSLFLYLVDNYTLKDEKNIKYINIWYYLKRNVRKDIYTFSLTQIKYSQFIKEKYRINIRKFAKAEFDFDEQVSVLNSLEQQFRSQNFK